MSDVTRLLDAAAAGDATAAERLLPLVYDELRRLAAQKLAHERPGQTLQPTALVHEAYLRLVGRNDEDRVERPRALLRRRGRGDAPHPGRERPPPAGGQARRRPGPPGTGQRPGAAAEPREDLLALDEALTKLAATNRQAAELVQLRYFAGLTLPEAAEAMGIAPRTAGRLWAYARAWLRREVEGSAEKT